MVYLTEVSSQMQQSTSHAHILLIKITMSISFLSQPCFNLPLSKEKYSLKLKYTC